MYSTPKAIRRVAICVVTDTNTRSNGWISMYNRCLTLQLMSLETNRHLQVQVQNRSLWFRTIAIVSRRVCLHWGQEKSVLHILKGAISHSYQCVFHTTVILHAIYSFKFWRYMASALHINPIKIKQTNKRGLNSKGWKCSEVFLISWYSSTPMTLLYQPHLSVCHVASIW